MIREQNGVFILDTDNTTYAFGTMPTGQLEHMYYGRKITIDDARSLREKHAFAPGNCNVYDSENTKYTLEEVSLEYSTVGKGDIREPMLEAICHDGSTTLDFVYDSYEISKGKQPFEALPGSFDESGEVDHLLVKLTDKNHGFVLFMNYYVYEKENVITRCVKFVNASNEEVRLTRALSLLLDVDDTGFVVSSFHGGWAREMKKSDVKLTAGKLVQSSFTGTSSSRCNPFFMVSDECATEDAGSVWGFNLIYSGNHYSAVEVSGFNKTRIVSGINPANFGFVLAPGEEFETPEAVMSYSLAGFTALSHNMHNFVREHIVRGEWAKKDRPILLNSWEAAYFDFNEDSLLKLAKKGKSVGVELFVMDDGWFGERNNDKAGLGDWDIVNKKKLPHGLEGLAKKINDLGMGFGLWVEPEMVNVDSQLYRQHPDWAIDIPGMNHSEGRNQRILDLCNPEVVDCIIEKLRVVFKTPGLSYVKWDMNRTFTDYYSKYLPANKQQEVAHRYVLGLYRMLDTLTKEFPHILFEGCSAGGNRFDLGALCYFPQIWASDNTDAVCRLSIQNGYSYGYPMNTVSAHVSACPNHQTLRITPLETRFAVASFGVLGYECNLCDMKKEDIQAIAAQIELYKQYRRVMQYGDFYRMRSDNIYEWSVVDKDKNTAVSMIMQREVQPGEQYLKCRVKGLDSNREYHFFGRKLEYSIKSFGDLVNTVAPIHIKPDSVVQDLVAKFVKMPGENENCTAYGDALMSNGVKLCQSYVGTGYDNDVRYFPDFGARLYFIENVK